VAERTVLLIAFQFPPFAGSSAVQRTLRFAKYLPNYGWTPVVLTAKPQAYESSGDSPGNEIPQGLIIHRAFGFDAARHLSLFGRYPGLLAIPDRWATWRPFAVRAARSLIERYDVSAIWSTFPIATAHAIGRDVARQTGLPWIAEFRDPMWQGSYPHDPRVNAAWRKLETEVFELASRVVVTTPGCKELYDQRFPSQTPSKVSVIQNGFDEEVFLRAKVPERKPPGSRGPTVLLHSGMIYPSERDPTQFLAALAALKGRGAISAELLQVVLRATGNDQAIQQQVNANGIADLVRIEPATGYLAAIEEMQVVDGLLILQAANCNAQIPAKLYEYLRAKRPILALTDPAGDTANTLRDSGTGIVARLDSQGDIEAALLHFMDTVRDPSWQPIEDSAVQRFSRAEQTKQLAMQLHQLELQPERRG
jgi:hypothetical protein